MTVVFVAGLIAAIGFLMHRGERDPPPEELRTVMWKTSSQRSTTDDGKAKVDSVDSDEGEEFVHTLSSY